MAMKVLTRFAQRTNVSVYLGHKKASTKQLV